MSLSNRSLHTVGRSTDRTLSPTASLKSGRIRMSPKLEHGVDPSVLRRALCQLGEVDDLRHLGRRGPLMASAGKESLFHCLFGRDAIRMAMDLLEDFPAVTRATLRTLASL